MFQDLQRSKVPEVTLIFWFIKILATTLGETGGDAVSMSMNLGYALSSLIFIGIFVFAVIAQISAKSFHPFLYWIVVVTTTTAGTTMADFADRSLGIGYGGGASLLFLLLLASLGFWYWSQGTISVNTITNPAVETFYWISILFSQTLGTALGDWMADTNEFGYEMGALVFSAGLVAIAAAYFWTCFQNPAVLGRLYPDATTRCHAGRPARQTEAGGWPGVQQILRVRNPGRRHPCLHRVPAAACRLARRRTRCQPLMIAGNGWLQRNDALIFSRVAEPGQSSPSLSVLSGLSTVLRWLCRSSASGST